MVGHTAEAYSYGNSAYVGPEKGRNGDLSPVDNSVE